MRHHLGSIITKTSHAQSPWYAMVCRVRLLWFSSRAKGPVLNCKEGICDGFLVPMVFRAKKVLLATFRRDVGWYEPQPEEILPRWEWYERDLLCLKHLQIPRCFEAKTMSHKKTYEFDIFADASTFGCIQCFHLTVQNEDENMHTLLVMGVLVSLH